MTDKYDDIIHLPHRQSANHPQMRMHDRAAQFAPFAALSGYGEAVGEAGRRTDERIEPDDDRKARLDLYLQILSDQIRQKLLPEVSVTYFVPDRKKAGGEYVTVTGTAEKIDDYERLLLLTDGRRIPIEDILSMEGEIFDRLSAE